MNHKKFENVDIKIKKYNHMNIYYFKYEGEVYFKKSDITITQPQARYTGCDSDKPIIFKTAKTVVPQVLYKGCGYVSETDLLTYISHRMEEKPNEKFTKKAVTFVKKAFDIELKETNRRVIRLSKTRKELEIEISMAKASISHTKRQLTKLMEKFKA